MRARSKLFIGNVVSAGSNAIVYVGKYNSEVREPRWASPSRAAPASLCSAARAPCARGAALTGRARRPGRPSGPPKARARRGGAPLAPRVARPPASHWPRTRPRGQLAHAAGGHPSAEPTRRAAQLVAVKVMRVEKMATSRAYQDYIKECNILHKARRWAAQAVAGPLRSPLPTLRRAPGGCHALLLLRR